MIINEQDIRRMVTECVSTLLEYHGVIGNKLEGLASTIVDRLRSGEDSFSFSKSELAEYYPYGNCPDILNVTIAQLGLMRAASYSPDTKTLKVGKIVSMCDREFAIEAVMHELTHLVNDSESDGSLLRAASPKLGDSREEKIAQQIKYLFDPSEIAARVTQFKYALKRNVDKDLGYFEHTTHLAYMKQLIEFVDLEDLRYDDAWTVVELLLYGRAWKKTNSDGKNRELNTTYENFEKAREAIVKKLTKAYERYRAKICKIYYDMKNGG